MRVAAAFILLLNGFNMDAPRPEKIPHPREIHGYTLNDDYFWLRERENPKVIEHLKAENAYVEASLAHLAPLRKKLYDEMLGRIQQTDMAVPTPYHGSLYYSRTEEGKPYPIYCRKKDAPDAREEILLDVNKLAAGKAFLIARPLEYSSDGNLMAYGMDPTGARIYSIHFRDLRTGNDLPDVIENTTGDITFAADHKTIFYTTQDAALRADKAWKRRLGDLSASSELIFHEKDERYGVGVSRSLSEEYLFLTSQSTNTSEWWLLSANDPDGRFKVIEPRREGVEYHVAQHGQQLYIVQNSNGAVNFELDEAPIASPGKANWKTVIAVSPDIYLQGVTAFKNHLVISQRGGGLPQVRIRKLDDGREHVIEFPEAAYSVGLGRNLEYDTNTIRLSYRSFVTPESVLDYDMNARTRKLLKEQPVLGGYDRTQYVVERLNATAPDGAQVPVSLVYKKGLNKNGQNPALLTAYGSYGFSSDVNFNSNVLSLLDRGFVFAVAHIRGGSEKGRQWYEDGRMMKKRNTFTDFIAAAELLVNQKYTQPEKLAIRGGSAGGLLMGAVVNMRPELFRVSIADVPFVDVINTMLDPNLPLTVTEYEQWGNPNEKAAFDYMRTYSPYDNVKAQAYPAILSMTSLHDTNVCYWEPVKWIARLRDVNTSNRPVLAHINMDAGHGGASDRYKRLEEDAYRYAFVIDQVLGNQGG